MAAGTSRKPEIRCPRRPPPSPPARRTSSAAAWARGGGGGQIICTVDEPQSGEGVGGSEILPLQGGAAGRALTASRRAQRIAASLLFMGMASILEIALILAPGGRLARPSRWTGREVLLYWPGEKGEIPMDVKEILHRCDHTLLAQTATWEEIRAICDDGMKYGCASVCIPASYVKTGGGVCGGAGCPSAPSSAFPTGMTPPPPSASWPRTPWTTAPARWIWSSTVAG